jgi:hypothetical protein
MQSPASLASSQVNMNPTEEIGILDIFEFINDGKYWIIASIVLCSLLGAGFAFLTPPQYEASASLEMAIVDGTTIEAPASLAEKLKLPLYYSNETFAACDVEHAIPSPGQYLANQLKPTVSKNTPIVSLQFKGKTPTDAKRCIESIVSDVRRDQSRLSKPILDMKKSQLLKLQQKLEGAEKLITLLPVKNLKFVFDDPKFSASALLLATLITKENEIKDLRNQINDMQVALSEPRTKGTTLVTPVYAPSTKVAPKITVLILSSAIAGMLLAILLLATRKVLRASNQAKIKD